MSKTGRRIEGLCDMDIAGTGPVGLALECALRRHGVHFRIFEERTRPQELLDGIGVRAALAERLRRVEQQTQFLNGHVTPSRALSKPLRRA